MGCIRCCRIAGVSRHSGGDAEGVWEVLAAATRWYEQALEAHPDMAAFNLGVIERDRGDTAAARRWFLRVADAYNVDALEEIELLDEDQARSS